MNKLKFFVAIALALAVFAVIGVSQYSSPKSADAATPPNIHIMGGPAVSVPGPSTGNTFKIEIDGSPTLPNLKAYSVVGSYDPTKIAVTLVTETSGIPSILCPGNATATGGGADGVPAGPNTQDAAFESTCGSTASSGFPTGPVIQLFTVKFDCLGTGTTTAISFDDPNPNSDAGEVVASANSSTGSLLATHTNGTVNCTALPTAAPTATATALPAGPVFEKDVDPGTPGVQTSANLWLCKLLCSTNGQGQLTITEVFFNPGLIGLGAFEFQVKFDHKIFDINIVSAKADCFYPHPPAALCDGTVSDADSYLAKTGRTVLCATTFTENYQLYRCGSADLTPSIITPGPADAGPNELAYIHVTPDADMFFRIRPTAMNGVVRMLLDENCEAATILGDPFPGSVDGGLAPICDDASITVRILEGDLNLDCKVDLTDIFMEAALYGAFFGRLDYDPWFDLEPKITDFDIDIKDVQFVAGRYGSTCDSPIPAQPPATAHVVAGL